MLVAVLALAVGAAAMLRAVGPGEVVVVRRRGGPARTRRRGLLVVLPGLHEVDRVPEQFDVTPLVVPARTADGVDVRIEGAAHVQVVDPVRATASETRSRAGQVLEAALADAAVHSWLADLARRRDSVRDRAAAAVVPDLRALGLELDTLVVDAIELNLTPDLLAWADRRPPSD
ncbi:hypothetical protein GCM10009547_37530 [Sporichthya brevicatena]|uniref:Band 7 domain-containing protein n=1 Tax=Sporichthya brevicatena TaxID=171442 RepID=A0ABN1H6G5_9ACTN